jgi:predicted permease
MRNLRLALRTLFGTPVVTTVAILSLALGIGANAAIFSLFDQTIVRAIPVRDPSRLVNLAAPGPKPGSQTCNQSGDCEQVFSYPMFRDLERVQTVFTGLAAHRLIGVNLAARGQTLNGEGVLVSGGYFPVLGIRPALGRLLDGGDDRAIGQSPVVVLSYAYWETRFGRDPGVLNESITVNGQSMTVVGVGPRGFAGTTIGARPHVFVPITMRESLEPRQKTFENRRAYWAYLFGRLKPGVSIGQARVSLGAQYRVIVNDVEAPLQKGMSEQTLARFRAKPILLEAGPHGQTSVAKEAKGPMSLLLGVTGFVLIIACANIANLLLARAASRSSEMAVRLAVGASRRQLVVQLMLESCVLAVLGGAAGLIVADWTLQLIASLLPAEAVAALQFELEPRVVLFAVLLTLGTGLLFGLFPALHTTSPDLVSSLKAQAGQPGGSRSAARFRTVLATSQIALSMALLVAAGLFTRSLANITRVNLGVKADNVVTFGISPALNGYKVEQSMRLFEKLEDDFAAIPGVTSASASLVPLLAGSSWGNDVSVEGYKSGPDTDMNSRYNAIGPGYFRTLGVPLLSGREFTRSDTQGAPKVVIINEAFAKKFDLGREAVGKHIGERDGKLDTEIVGLVRDMKYSDVKDPVPPMCFRPYRQGDRLGFLTFYVRTTLTPEDFLAGIPGVVRKQDANLPVENLRTLPQQVRENVFLDRMITVLAAAFASLATLLAAIGLYGVLAYTVAQRTREIGLRMALGAAPEQVRRMVLRTVGAMITVGGTIGLAGAIAVGRLGESLLFELKGSDPVVLAGAAVMLVVVALAAGFIPAHRASRIDPIRALRYE